MPDSRGRPWATVAQTRAGSGLVADDGFDCLTMGDVVIVEEDEDGGLYVPCAEGRHYLGGQLSADGTEYVGLWPVWGG